MSSYIERTASGHIILWAEFENECICLSLAGSRYEGMRRVQPGELEPDQPGYMDLSSDIEREDHSQDATAYFANLAGYTRRLANLPDYTGAADERSHCPHGLERNLCTICPQDSRAWPRSYE